MKLQRFSALLAGLTLATTLSAQSMMLQWEPPTAPRDSSIVLEGYALLRYDEVSGGMGAETIRLARNVTQYTDTASTSGLDRRYYIVAAVYSTPYGEDWSRSNMLCRTFRPNLPCPEVVTPPPSLAAPTRLRTTVQ